MQSFEESRDIYKRMDFEKVLKFFKKNKSLTKFLTFFLSHSTKTSDKIYNKYVWQSMASQNFPILSE